MVQGLSLSTMATSCSGCVCGSMPSWRKHFRRFGVTRKDQMSGERGYVWQQQYDRNVFVKGTVDMLRPRNVRVEAGWLFKGGDKGSEAISERSESANEDILIFFFQLDLATRVQALNVEEYDIAQQLRTKLAEVEAEVTKQQEGKRRSSSKSEAQDKAIRIIRLRADLQGAIESENYALAAKLRDDISKLETESLAISAKALAHQNAAYAFRLGQRVKHQKFGYRAVVCGMDPVCCESSAWMETARVQKLSRGSNQPFYQVLVDVHADPDLLVAYVAEENLLAPETPDVVSRRLLSSNPHRIDLIIATFHSYSTGWMQLVISSLSDNYARNSTGHGMRYRLTRRSLKAILKDHNSQHLPIDVADLHSSQILNGMWIKKAPCNMFYDYYN